LIRQLLNKFQSDLYGVMAAMSLASFVINDRQGEAEPQQCEPESHEPL